ncbi:Swt1 family HEPN domain-containing protein [Ruegeria arenilitoris]|uniref:Swt1 family HEPN domain-containing protein n=1 Tax=Ruegeria arenilitoris TaxID=1173585 RepID=UPI00147FE956|nr:Swt1 family HEPN domain-containing protein [Ruegeria arenilitoris]
MDKHTVRYFMLNNLSIESGVRQVAKDLEIDLGPEHQDQKEIETKFYPQFSLRIRSEAERMAKNYTIFYSLENSIRELISDVMKKHGNDWWEQEALVPKPVKENAAKNRKKEQATGVTPRSSDMLDYTNFGELGEIIKANWDDFADIFTDIRAVERILNNLNTLRAAIAHCTPLAEDEEVRLHLSLRDWFRQQA